MSEESSINFPWVGRNPGRCALLVCALALVLFAPLVLFMIAQGNYGSAILVFCAASAIGWPFLGTSLLVQRRMQKAESALAGLPGRVIFRSACLVVDGMIKQPAIAQITEMNLIIQPAFGRTIQFPLNGMRILRETSWFNGQLLVGGTRGFWLSVPGRDTRFGLAFADAARWREVLHGSSLIDPSH